MRVTNLFPRPMPRAATVSYLEGESGTPTYARAHRNPNSIESKDSRVIGGVLTTKRADTSGCRGRKRERDREREGESSEVGRSSDVSCWISFQWTAPRYVHGSHGARVSLRCFLREKQNGDSVSRTHTLLLPAHSGTLIGSSFTRVCSLSPSLSESILGSQSCFHAALI